MFAVAHCLICIVKQQSTDEVIALALSCVCSMEWPHRVGSLNFQVFSAKEPYFGWVLMQKKPRNLGSFLYVATPQCATHAATHCNTQQHNATCCCHHVVLCLVFDPAFCMCVSVCVCLRVCVCMCVSACSRNK